MTFKTLASASLMVATIGLALPTMAFAKADLKALDPDNDGTVSLDEAQQAGAKKFEALDPDHDGTIDKKEAKGAIPKKAFKAADPDKDGTIDKAEFGAAIEGAFKKADPDGDGTLDAKEFATPAGKKVLKLIE